MQQESAKLLMENLDQNVMRYKAMESAKTSLEGKKFFCSTTKSQPNDVVSTLATKWFSQKEAQK